MSGECVLITGGTGKFGRILTQHFLSRGDDVVILGTRTSTIREVTKENAGHKGRLRAIKIDLMGRRAGANLLRALDRMDVAPSCVINNARNTGFLKTQDDGVVSRENFADELLLDVIVPYEMTMAIALMPGGRLKNVINVGSMYGVVSANLHLYDKPTTQSPLHYSVAKCALVHLTKELATRLAPRKIRVNCVAYGGVEGRVDRKFKNRYAKLCPMGRMLREDEVAGPISMLISDTCSSVTGHTLVADGGWSLW
jgi:NAD(P)-dependent dehydrogenase (short-subunit alcohol dehydrogenase family)